jgi:hypothetical protein
VTVTVYLALLGAAIQLVGISVYIHGIIWGGVKPNRVTWLMWAIAPLVGTYAAVSTGVKWEGLAVFMAGVGPFLVFIASFLNKNAYWRLNWFDWICGAFSLLAIISLSVIKQPSLAIILAIVSDAFAAIPTLKKAWLSPQTEHVGPFVGGLFSLAMSAVSIKVWVFSAYAFPCYLIAVNGTLVLIALFRRKIGRASGAA